MDAEAGTRWRPKGMFALVAPANARQKTASCFSPLLCPSPNASLWLLRWEVCLISSLCLRLSVFVCRIGYSNCLCIEEEQRSWVKGTKDAVEALYKEACLGGTWLIRNGSKDANVCIR